MSNIIYLHTNTNANTNTRTGKTELQKLLDKQQNLEKTARFYQTIQDKNQAVILYYEIKLKERARVKQAYLSYSNSI